MKKFGIWMLIIYTFGMSLFVGIAVRAGALPMWMGLCAVPGMAFGGLGIILYPMSEFVMSEKND